MKFSQRVQQISPSPTVSINSMAQSMRAGGEDVLNFGAGEPDFNTPEAVKQAAIEAIRDNHTHYTSPSGIQELKKAIGAWLESEIGVGYQADEVIVTVGGKQALYEAFQALVQPGDEVLLPVPYWVSYPEQIKLAGAEPVLVQPTESLGIDLEALEAAITPHTRGLVLNSPSNPTGVVFSKQTIARVAELAKQHDLWVISDEIYCKLIYQGEHHSVAAEPGMKERTIIINGVSKAFAMTGWRIGFAAAPKELVANMNKLQGHLTSNPASISQYAALAAFEMGLDDAIASMREQYAERGKVMGEALNAMPGVSCEPAQGAFYLFPRVDEWYGKTIAGQVVDGSVDFARVVLEEAGVALVPGLGFGADEYVRLSYATDLETIKEGMERLNQLLSQA